MEEQNEIKIEEENNEEIKEENNTEEIQNQHNQEENQQENQQENQEENQQENQEEQNIEIQENQISIEEKEKEKDEQEKKEKDELEKREREEQEKREREEQEKREKEEQERKEKEEKERKEREEKYNFEKALWNKYEVLHKRYKTKIDCFDNTIEIFNKILSSLKDQHKLLSTLVSKNYPLFPGSESSQSTAMNLIKKELEINLVQITSNMDIYKKTLDQFKRAKEDSKAKSRYRRDYYSSRYH